MRRTALLILDGWGYSPQREFNAIAQAGTPSLDALFSRYPWTTIRASGMAVGLPEGQMGNSEVGHLNLGAGRIVYQDLTRINLAVESGEFLENEALNDAISAAEASGGALHLMGLLSDGGVHSHINHLFAILELAKKRGFGRVFVHAFLDGRDTPPQSGLSYVKALEEKMLELGVGRIATVGGRFWGMDRDTRWERVERAYRAMVKGEGEVSRNAEAAVASSYSKGEYDEFMVPTVIVGGEGSPVAAISDGDAVVFFNFRSDRARQMTRALTSADFNGFNVAGRPVLSRFVMFAEYDETFDLPIAFPPQTLRNILAEVLADHGLKQLRIAETEKYAHVTFFFNGGVEKSYAGEERVLIPSPREVATYDEKPSMSAFGVAERLVAEIDSGKFDCIVCNFANLDMVGHTGKMEAAKEAVRAVDDCIGRVVEALRRQGYAALITADHGNAEAMWDESAHQPMTAHTTNPVPLILVDDAMPSGKLLDGGILADIAPTLLELMGIDKPAEMTGKSLIP